MQVILRYPISPDVFPTYYKPSLWELLDKRLLSTLKLSHTHLSIRYDVVLKATGPAGADFFLLKLMSSKLKDLLRRNREIALGTPEFMEVTQIPSQAESDSVEEGRGTDTANQDELLQATNLFDRHLLSESDIPHEWLSPKLRAMIEVLSKHRSDKFQGIIFVEQRHVASTLVWILPRIKKTKEWLHCGQLTGHGEADSSGEALGGMSVKAQRDTVRAFKDGELNLRM